MSMSKQLVTRIKELKAQMADAKVRGNWSLYLDLNKSLGIMLLNER
jgi:hypothetical protein